MRVCGHTLYARAQAAHNAVYVVRAQPTHVVKLSSARVQLAATKQRLENEKVGRELMTGHVRSLTAQRKKSNRLLEKRAGEVAALEEQLDEAAAAAAQMHRDLVAKELAVEVRCPLHCSIAHIAARVARAVIARYCAPAAQYHSPYLPFRNPIVQLRSLPTRCVGERERCTAVVSPSTGCQPIKQHNIDRVDSRTSTGRSRYDQGIPK